MNTKPRTLQDLLAERRANILESMRETDEIAKGCLLAHVALIDSEINVVRSAEERPPCV